MKTKFMENRYKILGVVAFYVVSVIIYALFISFFLWFLGIWPAGDAKLFFTLFFFFPPQCFQIVLILDYLINTFVPIFFFMMFIIIYRSKLKLVKNALKYTFNPYMIFTIVALLIGFVWFVLEFIQMIFPLTPDYFISLLILFVAFEVAQLFLSEKLEIFFVLCAIARMILDYRNVYTFSFFFQFFSLIVVFLFFRFFILHLAYHLYSKKVLIRNLKPEMSPAEGIAKIKEGFERISFLNISLIDFMIQRKKNFIHGLETMSKKDVDKIKKLRKEGKIPFKSIRINETQPFAIFLLIGFLLTLFLEENFVNFLISLL